MYIGLFMYPLTLMKKADRLLVMVDSREGDVNPQDIHSLLPQSQQQLENLDLPVTVVLNKADLSGIPTGPRDDGSFVISATTGDGLPELREHLKAAAGFKGTGQGEGQSRFSARRRHITALQQALAALDNGEQQLHDHAAGELLAEDLRAAQKALEEITGAFTADDLLGRIFSSFCIGK